MNKHLVFVYGTLRRGSAQAMSTQFPNSKFIAEAKVTGSLHDLGSYPGLLLEESNSSSVIGEVYEVDDETLNRLDDFEASSYYQRKQVEVSLGTQRRPSWVFVPDPELCSHGAQIISGDWVEYAKTKTDWPDESEGMDAAQLKEFATRYTAAWCSQNAASVAAFFAEHGSLKINDGTPSVGRTAITAAAQEFMSAFPDMVVTMNGISSEGNHAVYRWTLTGTNTGPGGTGKTVGISGYEEWTIGSDRLIAESRGHFDEAEYQRQLNAGN
jgi:gamma-glutamylcyclotransferase (GGCT)/AIG2-like uncharacterized protein YtfP/predicted ester cyclase